MTIRSRASIAVTAPLPGPGMNMRRGRRGHLERVAGVDRRKRLLESTANGGERRRDGFDRRAGPEPPHNAQLVRLARIERASAGASVLNAVVRAERQPHFRSGDARPRESFRRHADDRELARR